MFSSGPNYTKLKTNLRLSQQRLKLLEKKKTELAQKARKEIADFIAAGKPERARIRVEQIIREDYLVEAMEIVEMYCDLLLARFGLITQLKELDEGIAEAVASLVWVAPRLQTDCQELKIVADVFAAKFGKPWAEAIRDGHGPLKASEKLQHKLAIHAPPKLLVEKYLIEIAKVYNIEYEPDPQVMSEAKDGVLIDLSHGPGPPPPAPGFMGFPTEPVPTFPILPAPPTNRPFTYPPTGGSGGFSGDNGGGTPTNNSSAPQVTPPKSVYPRPLSKEEEANAQPSDDLARFLDDEKQPPPSYYDSICAASLPVFAPKPAPRTRQDDIAAASFTSLPAIPQDLPEVTEEPKSEDIDFDDLSRRFEALKKKK